MGGISQWIEAGILISYDSTLREIQYISVATGCILRRHKVGVSDDLQNGDCVTPQGVVRPFADLSRAPFWRRARGWLLSWLQHA